jgi:transposase
MTTAKGSRGLESGGVEAGPRAKRRSWSTAERQRIVEAALAPGASVAGVARAHDVNANLVFKWIRRPREGWRDRRRALRRPPGADAAPSFVPVRLIAPEPTALKDAAAGKIGPPSRQYDPPRPARLGALEICLPNGTQVHILAAINGALPRLLYRNSSSPASRAGKGRKANGVLAQVVCFPARWLCGPCDGRACLGLRPRPAGI